MSQRECSLAPTVVGPMHESSRELFAVICLSVKQSHVVALLQKRRQKSQNTILIFLFLRILAFECVFIHKLIHPIGSVRKKHLRSRYV